jgi:hypothetical protein
LAFIPSGIFHFSVRNTEGRGREMMEIKTMGGLGLLRDVGSCDLNITECCEKSGMKEAQMG